MDLTFKDKTKYAEIFDGTYWGDFKIKYNELENQIILNRNKFIEDFQIKKIKDIPEKYEEYFHLTYNSVNKINKKFFDHIETYITHNKKYIVIVSPYSLQDRTAELLGYQKYNNLYGNNSYSYIKIF